MYHFISDFLRDWKYETEATQKVFDNLTEKSLSQRVNPEGRTLARLAWHITSSIGEMLGRVGLHFDCPDGQAPIPSTLAEIRGSYGIAAVNAAKLIEKDWTDATLLEEHDMYGEQWKNGVTLSVLNTHQIHHRAQMTVLMRQAGLKVPGIYGPSKEEWLAYGMPAQE